MTAPPPSFVEPLSRDGMVAHYVPLVQRIAQRLRARLPANIELGDLVQAGLLGLLDALDQHGQPMDEGSFVPYASVRIRGAMLDELRAQDWLPRRARQREQQMGRAMAAVEQRLGRSATDEELAAELGWSLQAVQDALRDSGGQLLYLEDLAADNDAFVGQYLRDGAADIPSILGAEEFQRCLNQAITHLPEREQLVLALYYQEELTLKEIGAVLDLTESRVSQIVKQAVLRLRAGLLEWRETA